MIIVDTNVVSELVRLRPAPQVAAWLAAPPDDLAISAITIGELLTGVAILPDGARKTGLAEAIETVLLRLPVRVPYDDSAARAHARLRATARRVGRGLSVEDGMIAATCLAQGAALATRNVADFDFLPVLVVNPWE